MLRKLMVPVFLACAIGALAIACGGGEEERAPAPTPTPTPPPTPGPGDTPQQSTGAEEPSDCELREDCQRSCAMECALEEADRTNYFDQQKTKVAEIPFQMRLQRVYLKGECHSGAEPERRRNVDGVASVIEGTLTYTGDDVLFRAQLGGEMYLQFGPDQYREVFAAENRRSYWSRRLVSHFFRTPRGEDPWRSGETRGFHWESRHINPVFCESQPQAAQSLIALVTYGVRYGRKQHTIGFANLQWDEVVGMSLDQPVALKKRDGRSWTTEPAKAHFSKLDKMLITRPSGKTEWVRRDTVIQTGDLVKGANTTFPALFSTSEWRITVTGISSVRTFGGYVPRGEDQFLAVVDLQLQYVPPAGAEGEAPPPGKLRGAGFRLETTPGRWQRPVNKAVGQIDLSGELAPGSSIAGKVVFPRQRFERPFRLEVKTPDRQTTIIDIFNYAVGPERIVR